MPYDPQNDPHATAGEALLAHGAVGKPVTPSDAVDLAPYPRAVVTLTAGNLALIPIRNPDATVLVLQDLPSGWVSPWRVRRVLATGTTATVATVEG